MKTITLTEYPLALCEALRRIDRRERAQRRKTPGILTHIFQPAKAHARTTRTCRLGRCETVITNL